MGHRSVQVKCIEQQKIQLSEAAHSRLQGTSLSML